MDPLDTFQLPEPYQKYHINKDGDVYNTKTNRKLKWWMSKSGYKYLSLWIGGKQFNRSVHRLLGLTFISNPNQEPNIDHIDRNKLNNNLGNLRWASVQENCINKDYRYNPLTNTKGVTPSKNGKRYNVTLFRNGRKIWLGVYDYIDEAMTVYEDAVADWSDPTKTTLIF